MIFWCLWNCSNNNKHKQAILQTAHTSPHQLLCTSNINIYNIAVWELCTTYNYFLAWRWFTLLYLFLLAIIENPLRVQICRTSSMLYHDTSQRFGDALFLLSRWFRAVCEMRHPIIWQCIRPIWNPFYHHGLTLISAWISNHIHYEMWGWNYLFIPELQRRHCWIFGCISNIISDFSGHMITYPCCD